MTCQSFQFRIQIRVNQPSLSLIVAIAGHFQIGDNNLIALVFFCHRAD